MKEQTFERMTKAVEAEPLLLGTSPPSFFIQKQKSPQPSSCVLLLYLLGTARIMRALNVVGIFVETGESRYAHNDASMKLTDDQFRTIVIGL